MQWRRMTLYQTLSGASLVFCALQDTRLCDVADVFADRDRLARGHPAGPALCIARPQASDLLAGAARDLWIFAARQPSALPAGDTLSAVGCRARRAGRNHRARRIDRGGYLGRAWHAGGARRA